MPKNAHGEGTRPYKYRDRWQASVTVGFDTNGKQKKKWVYAKTQKECLKKWNALKAQQAQGTLAPGEEMTFAQYLEHWFRAKAADIEARSLEEYRYTARHVLPHLGRHKLGKLTPLHVQTMQLELAEKVSARQAVAARGLVSNILSDAVNLGLLHRNVCDAVKRVKYEPNEYPIWSAAEILRFLAVSKTSSYYPFFYTALTTGMRPGELIALHWRDVEEGALNIRHTVSMVNNRPVLKVPKTKRSRRVIAIPDDTAALLAELRSVSNHPLVFTQTGNYLQHGNIRRALHSCADNAEVKRIRPHDMRHCYASMAVSNGMNVADLSRHLGHASAAFTLKVYVHMFERQQQRAAPSLSELLGDKDFTRLEGEVLYDARNDRT